MPLEAVVAVLRDLAAIRRGYAGIAGKIGRRVAELDFCNAGECSETPVCQQRAARCSFGDDEFRYIQIRSARVLARAAPEAAGYDRVAGRTVA